MYRGRIRDTYDALSRSYRKVAEFIMSNYYEVSFMTAAQLAFAVGVDTTTVVRFSQRLGYNGYPDLLADIREQVRDEIYAAYKPQELSPTNPAHTFKKRLEQEQQNLAQTVIQNPPDHIRAVEAVLARAKQIMLVAEGYANTVAAMAAQQLRHRGIAAEALEEDLVKRAASLTALRPGTLVIGISATQYGDDVARALTFAHNQGCSTLGVVGSLASPVNRVSDLVIYAPTESQGPLPSITALTAVMSALVQIAAKDSNASATAYIESFNNTYQFLREREDLNAIPE